MAAKKAPKAEATKTAPKAKKKAPANPFTGDSKFAKFLTSKKLDARRVLAASHELEQLQRTDRDIKLARKRAKSGGDEVSAEKKAEAMKAKPRSGRAVTPRAMSAAVKGGAISGPTKSRILRAVNHLLEQKKQEKVDLKALF